MVAGFLRVLGVYFGLKCLSRLSDYDLTRNQDTIPSPNHFFYLSTNNTLPRVGSFYSYRLLSFRAGSARTKKGFG